MSLENKIHGSVLRLPPQHTYVGALTAQRNGENPHRRSSIPFFLLVCKHFSLLRCADTFVMFKTLCKVEAYTVSFVFQNIKNMEEHKMNSKELEKKEFLTVADVQRWLNLSQAAAYGLTHRKDFPVARFGGAIRIPREPFLAWVAANTSNPRNYGVNVA